MRGRNQLAVAGISSRAAWGGVVRIATALVSVATAPLALTLWPMLRTLLGGSSLALLLAGCFSTSYDLTSAESSRRQWSGMAPPPGWMVKAFDDSSWPETREPVTQLSAIGDVMPALYVRQRFDLGPDPLAYQTLTVHFDGLDGGYQAWINGQMMTPGADGAQHLTVDHGAIAATGNVLALAIHSNRAAVAMNARLDGDAHPSGAQIVKGPYLLNPTNEGVTVAWETADDTAARAVVDGIAWDGDLAGADARGLRSFVVLHWGPVCGCAGYQHGSNDEANVILKVATRHQVAALFSGHNHLYERGVTRGIPYVVTGGGGAPLNMDPGKIDSTLVTFKQYHYVLIDMGPDGVHLSTKGADGLVLDDAML